ncbi:hypothetical protein Pmani_021300 [Petrolisthes manimaculis]|uniref:Uncharacterized protein n=1 Tax=Petrolisthes manimaculis TaxID=1843537 RepID=A0AAE1U3D0_9EUCA|nr:hypothetical protein Pmani_021300 [Petrolisthes manimaculis]
MWYKWNEKVQDDNVVDEGEEEIWRNMKGGEIGGSRRGGTGLREMLTQGGRKGRREGRVAHITPSCPLTQPRPLKPNTLTPLPHPYTVLLTRPHPFQPITLIITLAFPSYFEPTELNHILATQTHLFFLPSFLTLHPTLHLTNNIYYNYIPVHFTSYNPITTHITSTLARHLTSSNPITTHNIPSHSHSTPGQHLTTGSRLKTGGGRGSS